MKEAQRGRGGLAEQILEAARRSGLERYLLETPLVVAVSGGADSLALLHCICELRGERAPSTLHVAHLDHGFRGEESRADAIFVTEEARSLGLGVTVGECNVPAYAKRCGLSPEDAARRARYSFLSKVCLEHGEAVAVAHTANDQAETVLLHLLRGMGVGGLAGMKMLSRVPVEQAPDNCPGNGPPHSFLTLYRPLLTVPRSEIEEYCGQKGLQPRVDPTNETTAYRRNVVRHTVLPVLEAVSPGIREHLVRLAHIAAADDEALQSLARREFDSIVRIAGDGQQLEFLPGEFAARQGAIQRRLVRLAFERVAGTTQDLEMSHVDKAVEVLSGAPGSPPAADLPRGVQVRREAGRAWLCGPGAYCALLETEIHSSPWPLLEPGTSLEPAAGAGCQLLGGWELMVETEEERIETDRAGDYTALFDMDALLALGSPVVRPRQSGDFLRPLGLGGTKSLQDLFVDAKIPRSLREYVTVLGVVGTSEIVWVPGPGGRRSGIALVKESTRRVIIFRFRRTNE